MGGGLMFEHCLNSSALAVYQLVLGLSDLRYLITAHSPSLECQAFWTPMGYLHHSFRIL